MKQNHNGLVRFKMFALAVSAPSANQALKNFAVSGYKNCSDSLYVVELNKLLRSSPLSLNAGNHKCCESVHSSRNADQSN